MGTYDKINNQKEKFQKQIDELNNKLSTVTEKNKQLEQEIKQLKYERYQDSRGAGEVDKLKKQNKFLESEVARFKKTSFRNESYEVFSKERQTLIKNIKSLSSNQEHIRDIFHKFISGTNELLVVAKIANKGTLTIRDCYTHLFRDTLICLFEKTMKVLSGKMNKGLNSILYDCINNKKTIDEKYIKDIPTLANKQTFKKLQYLVYLENTAFHGYSSPLKNKSEPLIDSEVATEQFLKLSKEEQLDTFFTLLQIMYNAFTCSSSEYILTQIVGCWKYTLS